MKKFFKYGLFPLLFLGLSVSAYAGTSSKSLSYVTLSTGVMTNMSNFEVRRATIGATLELFRAPDTCTLSSFYLRVSTRTATGASTITSKLSKIGTTGAVTDISYADYSWTSSNGEVEFSTGSFATTTINTGERLVWQVTDATGELCDYVAGSVFYTRSIAAVGEVKSFGVFVSTPAYQMTVSSFTPITIEFPYAVTLGTVTAYCQGTGSAVIMVSQRTKNLSSAANGINIWSENVTVPADVATGGTPADFTVPTGSKLVVTIISVTGDVQGIYLSGTYTKD